MLVVLTLCLVMIFAGAAGHFGYFAGDLSSLGNVLLVVLACYFFGAAIVRKRRLDYE